MAYTTLRGLLKAIADAVRSKTSSTAPINAQDLPEAIAAISGDVMYSDDGRCYTANIIIPSGKTAIGYQAYFKCRRILTITMPDGLKTVGVEAFGYCEWIDLLKFPNSITSIGNYVCEYCSSMRIVVFPNSCTSIPYAAFNMCTSLQLATISINTSIIDAFAFSNCNYLTRISYLDCTKNDIVNQNRFTFPNHISSIGNYAFQNCYRLLNIKLFGTTSIGTNSFYNCYSLFLHGLVNSYVDNYTDVIDINNFVGFIGYNVIDDNNVSITKYRMGYQYTYYPKNFYIEPTVDGKPVTSINITSKEGSPGIVYDISIPDTVVQIGNDSFSDFGISSVYIPDSVIDIGIQAFHHCKRLTSVRLSSNMTELKSYVFHDCPKLRSVSNTNNIMVWGYNCLANTGITYISIPLCTTTISNHAFSSTSLDSIYYAGTIAQWQSITIANNAFNGCGTITVTCTDGTVTING